MPRNKFQRTQDPRAGRGIGSNKPAFRVPPPVPSLAQSTTGTIGPDELRHELDRLEELHGQIKDAIQQGHELLKDLRIESRQARRILPMIVTNKVKTKIEQVVQEEIGTLEAVVEKAKDDILRKFNELYDQLMGADSKSKKNGLKPLPELIATLHDVSADAEAHARQLDLENAANRMKEVRSATRDRSGRTSEDS